MSWDDRLHRSSARAVYLHLPFCARKCNYCDFASFETRRDDTIMERYARALARQIGVLRDVGLLEECQTAYLGGGTPTLLSDNLPLLVRTIRASCPNLVEFTSEANPDSLSLKLTCSLYRAGLSRLSIGVQSTRDAELRSLGRIHGAQLARSRVCEAVSTGLDVSCDLMCAISGQTAASWQRSVDDVLSWGVCHVSVYPLQIAAGTPLAQSLGDVQPEWNASDIQADRMEQARITLESAGFLRYEVASYARPQKTCRHNIAYWTAEPYVGLGFGAAGMLTREAYGRLRSLCPQLPALPGSVARVRTRVLGKPTDVICGAGLEKTSFGLEFLSTAQAAAEDLMCGMRLTSGIGVEQIAYSSSILGESNVRNCLERLFARGLICQAQNHWMPTHEGWLLGNELFGALWDLAPTQCTQTMEVEP